MDDSEKFNGIFEKYREKLHQNQDEWTSLIEKGHPHLSPIREAMLEIGEEDTARCILCYVPSFGFDDEVDALRLANGIQDLDISRSKFERSLIGREFNGRVDRRSKRNQLFCNCCDGYINAFPGGAVVELPILITDVRKSTSAVTSCSADEGAVIGLELRRQVSNIAAKYRGFLLQDRGDGFMHSFPYGFAPHDVEDKKSWALEKAVRAAVRIAAETSIPSPASSTLRLGVGLSHSKTYVGAPDIDLLPNRIDMVLVLGSATATISARLSDMAEEGSLVVAKDTLVQSGVEPDREGWKVSEAVGAIVPAVQISL